LKCGAQEKASWKKIGGGEGDTKQTRPLTHQGGGLIEKKMGKRRKGGVKQNLPLNWPPNSRRHQSENKERKQGRSHGTKKKKGNIAAGLRGGEMCRGQRSHVCASQEKFTDKRRLQKEKWQKKPNFPEVEWGNRTIKKKREKFLQTLGGEGRQNTRKGKKKTPKKKKTRLFLRRKMKRKLLREPGEKKSEKNMGQPGA